MNPENFATHSIFDKLNQLQDVLIKDDAKEKIDTENYTFFNTFYQYVVDKLKLTIPNLVQEPELANLTNEIESGTSQINSFLGNSNTGYLTNAINNFNSALNRVRNLPYALSKNDFNFSKVASDFQITIKDAYQKLEDSNKKLQENLNSIQQDLADKNTKLEAIEKQLAEKDIEIQNIFTSYSTEFETIKTNNNIVFNNEQNRFKNEFESERKLLKEKLESDTETNKGIFETKIKELKTASDQVIKNLNTKLEEANKIVNIVGNVGVTGNYQNIANQNRQSANFFRWVALGFMIVMSLLLIWSIIELSTGEFNLYKSLVRILAAAVLTYPAVYASRESTKHRMLETKNRNLELELASIGPFIELLPDDNKQKIKEELVSKYFGNHSSINDDKNGDEDISINALEKIMKAVLPFLKK
ncbi:hypothetical protein HZP90_09400 [Elizabethkingia anophelis]|nr:hypothetical protein [Elizabethkingia anophelis]MCT4058833.1 hypothetical protein [Elizabethkingia anophelis]MCT4069442.1 hypothetical protein [Elizabethkingia anophelis]